MTPKQVAHAVLVVRGGRGLTTTDYYLGGVVMVLEVMIELACAHVPEVSQGPL